MYEYLQKYLFLKISFPCPFPVFTLSKTKDEPRMNLRNNRSSTREIRTPKQEKSSFIKIAISFTSLIPSPIPPTDDRENTDSTPTQLPAHKKCCFLRLLPNKVVLIPKKVDSFPKTVDYIPKIVAYPPNKKSPQNCIFLAQLLQGSRRQGQRVHQA